MATANKLGISPHDQVADDECLDARLNTMGSGVDEVHYGVLSHLPAAPAAIVQIHQLRTAPEGSYT